MGPPLFGRAGIDSRGAAELAMHAGHALDFALGGEALVEPLDAEGFQLLAPGAEPLLPALEPALGGLAVLARKIGAHADHRFECHGLGHHVIRLAPGFAPYALGGLEEIAHHAVIA